MDIFKFFEVPLQEEKTDKKGQERMPPNYVQYTRRGDDFVPADNYTSESKIPSGIYTVYPDQQGHMHFVAQKVEKENILPLPGTPVGQIIQKIENFLKPEIRAQFKKFGMLYKRGILLYGPPGTGKTSVSYKVMEIGVLHKDMVVLLNPNPAWVKACVQGVRAVEKTDRPVMVVWEDFEGLLRAGEERRILSLLDGVDQVDNIIYLANTNHINLVPNRIKNRPSRFADVLEIGLPDKQVRRTFLEAKARSMEISLDTEAWVNKTDGLSIDHLKDLLISVVILGVPFDEALTRMKALAKEVAGAKDE